MSRTTHSLIELVHALEHGITFYDQAARWARNPSVVDALFRMRHVKTTIAAALAAEVAVAPGAGHEDGAWIGALGHGYADMAAKLLDACNDGSPFGIQAQEERLLDAFRLVAASDPSERVRTLVQRHVPDVQRMHDEICNLPRSWAA